MKNGITALLAGALIVLGAAASMSAMAQSAGSAPAPRFQGHDRGFGRFHRGPGGEFVSTLLRAVREEGKTNSALALTDAQKQQIKTLMQSSFKSKTPPTGPDLTVVGNPISSGFAGAVQNAQTAASNRVLADSNLATQIYQSVLTGAQQQALTGALQTLQTQAQSRRQFWQSKLSKSAG